jgi:hypothetical protein
MPRQWRSTRATIGGSQSRSLASTPASLSTRKAATTVISSTGGCLGEHECRNRPLLPATQCIKHAVRGLHVRIACHSTTAPTRTTTVAARRPNGGRARRTRACCAYLAPHQARPSPSRHVGAMQRIAAAPRASAAARRHACRTSRPAEPGGGWAPRPFTGSEAQVDLSHLIPCEWV